MPLTAPGAADSTTDPGQQRMTCRNLRQDRGRGVGLRLHPLLHLRIGATFSSARYGSGTLTFQYASVVVPAENGGGIFTPAMSAAPRRVASKTATKEGIPNMRRLHEGSTWKRRIQIVRRIVSNFKDECST